jgi:hypothetical protein
MKTDDPIQLVAAVNPVPLDVVSALATAPEREFVRARIDSQRHNTPRARSRRPAFKIAIALVIALALAVPALAFSGILGSLFGFSNQGTPVPSNDLSRASAVLSVINRLTGAPPGSLVQLASRDGWTFYAARAANGDICYFDEAPPNSVSDGIPNPPDVPGGGSCKNAAGEADFPSPARPVFNMSHYLNNSIITTLAGVAADGVASLQVLALSDCHVVATAPVIDNVYIADNLPMIPEAQIVARDDGGRVVWHQAVGAAIEPAPAGNSCGLG